MDIFSIFQQDDSQVFQEHEIQELFNDNYTNLGRVITSVENYLLLDQIYLKKYPQKYEQVRHSIKNSYLLKVLLFLENVNIDQENLIQDFLQEFTLPRITASLTYLLHYFEDIEYYEKCIIIKKILDNFIGEKLDTHK